MLFIDRAWPIRARVLAQKSEEATASSASLLATPLLLLNQEKQWALEV